MGRAITGWAVALLGWLTLSGAAFAQDFGQNRWAIAPTIGTDGIGADLKYQATSQLVFRLRGTWLDYNHGFNSDGIHYSGKLKYGVGGGYIDWHPWRNGLLLSAGVLGGDREVDLDGFPASSVTLAGHTYTAAQIGAVNGRAKLPSAAGFVGVGYDSTFVHRGPIGFNVLAGVQLSGASNVQLTPTGLLANTPQLQSDVASEEGKIRHDLDFTQTYPAISIGLSYRF